MQLFGESEENDFAQEKREKIVIKKSSRDVILLEFLFDLPQMTPKGFPIYFFSISYEKFLIFSYCGKAFAAGGRIYFSFENPKKSCGKKEVRPSETTFSLFKK